MWLVWQIQLEKSLAANVISKLVKWVPLWSVTLRHFPCPLLQPVSPYLIKIVMQDLRLLLKNQRDNTALLSPGPTLKPLNPGSSGVSGTPWHQDFNCVIFVPYTSLVACIHVTLAFSKLLLWFAWNGSRTVQISALTKQLICLQKLQGKKIISFRGVRPRSNLSSRKKSL